MTFDIEATFSGIGGALCASMHVSTMIDAVREGGRGARKNKRRWSHSHQQLSRVSASEGLVRAKGAARQGS